MRIGVIGAGRIGGNVARQAARAGHQLRLSFSRDASALEELAYVPVELGRTDGCHVIEAPRRPGAVPGEEYRAGDAEAVTQAVRDGREIPPTPTYE
jgi:predicted dinucleotide-binding enzyme